jgi:acyl-CoA thioesterase FadM
MAFFAMQYRILFHDTMAYGSHHHMTNLKFQNTARETLLFESRTNGKEDWREQLANIVMLTREAYSFNIAPVNLGEKVAILLSYEDPSRSTVRLCFRVVRWDGKPVSCGYQTLVLIHKDTQDLVPAPPMLAQYLDPSKPYSLVEELAKPSFAARLHNGGNGIKQIMSPDICSLGAKVAGADLCDAHPRIIAADGQEFEIQMKEPSLQKA